MQVGPRKILASLQQSFLRGFIRNWYRRMWKSNFVLDHLCRAADILNFIMVLTHESWFLWYLFISILWSSSRIFSSSHLYFFTDNNNTIWREPSYKDMYIILVWCLCSWMLGFNFCRIDISEDSFLLYFWDCWNQLKVHFCALFLVSLAIFFQF